jgi:HSP20 family molecular chaperone IbpA
MTVELETGDMLVVTVPVPARAAAELQVTLEWVTVRVAGPHGFLQEVALPKGADPKRLHAGLFHGILELRAPRAECQLWMESRRVAVSDLG